MQTMLTVVTQNADYSQERATVLTLEFLHGQGQSKSWPKRRPIKLHCLCSATMEIGLVYTILRPDFEQPL